MLSATDINNIRNAYAGLNKDTMSAKQFIAIHEKMESLYGTELDQLVAANIPVISNIAKNVIAYKLEEQA